MDIKRRSVIKSIIILTGGVSLLPSCFHEDDKTSLALKHVKLTGSDERLFAEIEETIIPATDTPGAKDLSLNLFTLKMIDDCFDEDKQQQFVRGLKEIDAFSKKKSGNTFLKCTASQREEILTNIENRKGCSDDVYAFYAITKYLTIQGYMTSKYVMTKLVIYELVPGRFHGSYPVSKNNRRA
jgi:hypothetical protein